MLPAWLRGEAGRARLAAEGQALLPRRGQSPLRDQEHCTNWGRVPGFRHIAAHTSQGQSGRTRERHPIFPMGRLRPRGAKWFVQELPLARPGARGAPRAAQLALLPAQFLFLVLRSCDERGFSSHTSSERLGGAGPPTAASLRLPLPFRALGLQTQKRGCLVHPPHPTGLLST